MKLARIFLRKPRAPEQGLYGVGEITSRRVLPEMEVLCLLTLVRTWTIMRVMDVVEEVN